MANCERCGNKVPSWLHEFCDYCTEAMKREKKTERRLRHLEGRPLQESNKGFDFKALVIAVIIVAIIWLIAHSR